MACVCLGSQQNCVWNKQDNRALCYQYNSILALILSYWNCSVGTLKCGFTCEKGKLLTGSEAVKQNAICMKQVILTIAIPKDLTQMTEIKLIYIFKQIKMSFMLECIQQPHMWFHIVSYCGPIFSCQWFRDDFPFVYFSRDLIFRFEA